MKKITSIIMICFATLLHGQTFLTVKTIKYENNRISAYNVQGYVVYQVDCKDFVWQRNPDLTIKIWDDIHSYTVNSTSLTSPAWAVVEDSLRAWQTNCSIISTSSTNAQTNLDTSQVDTSLVLPLFLSEINNTLKLINSKGYDSSQVDTSLIVPLYLNEIKEILFAINAKTTDSTHQDTSFIVPVYLEQIKDLLAIINNKTQDTTQTDTSIIVPSYLSQIAQTLDLINSRAYDSSQVDTSLINYIASFDTTINRLDSILASIKRQSSIDTTHTAILNDIKELISKLDTSSIDTSLVPMVDYSELFYALINKGYDTSQVDTALDKHILLDSTSVRILNDSIKVYFNQILDTSNSGVLLAIHNLLKDSLDKNVFINNDSLRVWFEQKNDTIDFEYKTYCYRGKSDSGVYSLSFIFSALTPYTPIFMNFLNVDSLSEIFRIDNRLGTTFGTYPNLPQDYVPCEKWNEYLIANSKKDTTKGLVYTQIAKVRTDRDTLFNCKSVSFGRKGGASGNLILTYENGESETFNIATDDLPSWINGEFLSYLDYNATGTTGLIVNTVGCSQTSDNICAKVKPVFDCELNIPIQCLGWQSASGVWQSASGCWNTGQ